MDYLEERENGPFGAVMPPTELVSTGKHTLGQWGLYATNFGEMLIAIINNKICYAAMKEQRTVREALSDLDTAIPNVQWQALNQSVHKAQPLPYAWTSKLFESNSIHDFHCVGTNFQKRVWEALLQIPPGQTMSYEALAVALGSAKWTRAAARAVANNKIAIFIPCHRVIKKSGAIHQYRWGAQIKKLLLEYEKYHYPR